MIRLTISISINAPSHAEEGAFFKVDGYVRDDGQGLVGVTVSIYVDGSYVSATVTGSNGYYQRDIYISIYGSYTLSASSEGVLATRIITIYYVPIPFSISVYAPSGVYTGDTFKIYGYVTDQYGNPYYSGPVTITVAGQTHTAYGNWSTGYYSVDTSIPTAGTYTIRASAGSVSATKQIQAVAPEEPLPEPPPEEPPYIYSISISAPSGVYTGDPFTVSGVVKDQYGYGYGGVTVKLYKGGSLFASIFTDSSGGYSKSTSIGTVGTYPFKAVADSVQATTDIQVVSPEEPPPPEEPSYVYSVTISAPSRVEAGQSFVISGTVRDQYWNGLSGVPVALYIDAVSLGSATSGSGGSYSKQVSVAAVGTYTLKAVAGETWATQAINVVTPISYAESPILESAYIREGYPNTNYRNSYLEVNWSYTSFLLDLSLIKVSLANIPPGAKIKAAKLQLYCNRLVSTWNDAVIDLYGTDGAWSEATVTWNNAPGGFGATPGSATKLSPGLIFEGVNKWVEVPFSQTGLNWLNSRAGGTTTLIVAATPVNYNFGSRYYSHRYTSLPPRLLIAYETTQNTTITLQADRATINEGESVNFAGVLSLTDTGNPLPGMPVIVRMNGVDQGTVQTNVAGVYGFTLTFPAAGTYTVAAVFMGYAELSASAADTQVTAGGAGGSALPILVAAGAALLLTRK